MRKRRKHGISLLIPTQNSEQTVELCIKSFLEFADELIVVDNGSSDQTIEIVKDLENKIDKLTFYNVPDLPDLYHNRQYAFERSHYNWIVRIDSDYIAYTSGQYDIKNLRTRILETKRGIIPKTFTVMQVNLEYDYLHTGVLKEDRKGEDGKYVPPPITSYTARVIQAFTGLKFIRRKRWEGIRFQNFTIKIVLDKPYWFHCNFKDKVGYLFRSERTNWRQLGDFTTYPTLEAYVVEVISEKYNTNNIEKAADIYMETQVFPFLQKYEPKKYFPYPIMIEKSLP